MKAVSIKQIQYALLLLILIFFIGNIGFMVIEGFSFTESFFMTIITISKVGFQEVEPLSDAGRIFTAFLIINPSPDIKLTNKDQIFVLGTQIQINKLKDLINFG